MNAILSVVSGGSVVQSVAVQAGRGAGVARMKAQAGGRYILADAQNEGLANGIIVKRSGRNLLLLEEFDNTERQALIVEDFFVNQARLFGLAGDGNYQPYVERVAEAVGAPALEESAPSLLQLATTPATALSSSALIGTAAFTAEYEPLAMTAVALDAALGNAAVVQMAAAIPPEQISIAAAPELAAALEKALVNQPAVPSSDGATVSVAAADAPVADAIRAPATTDAVEEQAVVSAALSREATEAAIDAMLDDQGAVQGTIQNGGYTDDGRPQMIGKAETGVVVHIYNGAELIGRVTTGATGQWSFIPRLPMADGQHVISVMYEYPDGDVSDVSAPYVIFVDKIAPDIPVISGMLDDQGRIQGQIESGAVTDDNRPTISGSAEPNTTVIIYDKGVELDRITVNADGTWNYTPSAGLEDGLHILDYAVVDRAGNMSEKTGATQFVVDTRPELVEIYAAEDDVGAVKGNVMSGGVTDDTQPRLFGTATAGGIVKIYEGAQLLGQVTAGVDGKWEFTPPSAMGEGTHALTATVSTEAKGESERSPAFEFTIDTTPPDRPTIDQVHDDRGLSQGALTPGQSTDDTTPRLSGKAEAGSTVRVYDNGVLLGSTLADAAGKWSFTPNPALEDGEHVFSATSQDLAGSVSGTSDGFKIVVDTVPAPTPTIDAVYDDQGAQTGYLSSGDITDDSKPTISGSAEAFAKVVIRDHGLEIGYAMADADGKWTFEPFLPMGLGLHKLTAEAIDAAGNVSAPSSSFELTLGSPDRPAVPAITSVVDDVGSVTGNLQKNDVTDDARPTINGTAQAGMVISVYFDGTLAGTTLVGADGQWSFTPVDAMADGLHTITAKASNSVGNSSEPTGGYPIIVDTTPPVAPVEADAALWDDAGQITGQITNGTVTDDNTPTFVGKAEPNATVVIYDGEAQIGRVSADAAGNWRFTPSPVLAEGDHALSYEVVDKAGNVGARSPVVNFEVDTRNILVAIDGATDDAGSITGEIGRGGITDDTLPTLHGRATAGGTVKVYEGSTLLGQTLAGSDGKWSFTPPLGLSEGAHVLSATVTTAANGESAKSEVFDFTIDLTAPLTPTIEQINDDVGARQGLLSQGQSTDDTTPTLSGKAEAGSTVRIYDGGSLLGSVVANNAGDWSFTVSPPLLNGGHDFTVTAEDKVGNLSEKSEVFNIVIDTVAPGAPVIVSVYDDQGDQKGPLNPGDATDDTKPTLSGTAEPHSTVVVMDGGHEIGRVVAGADGSWTLEPSLPMGLGEHKLTAVAIDAAGNVGDPSNAFDIVIGSPDLPVMPVIVAVIDDVGSLIGAIQKGGVTDDARPTITGTAQAGMTISIYIDGVLSGTTVAASNGDWSYTPTADLADGEHNITATATNALGNISAQTGAYPIVVDTVPPLMPVPDDATLWDDVGKIVGRITNGTVTDDNTPTFNGTTEPNATVVIYDKGVEIGRTTTNASGQWSFTPSPVLDDGAHTLNYEVVDQAGNVGPRSPAIDFTVDTAKVEIRIEGATDDVGSITGAISKGGVTDDTLPTLHGLATAGGTVKVYEGSVLLGETVAGGDGTWSLTLSTALASGLHNLTATVTTAASGESEASAGFDFYIDLTAPDAPSIVKVIDDVGTPQGALSKGQSTDDATPSLSGRAEAGSTVHIYDNGKLLGSVVADPAGDWNFTPQSPLLDGTHEFTARAEDAAGNLSAPSEMFDILVDTVPPDRPVIDTVHDDQGARTGNVAAGGTTDDARPTIGGSAEAGSTVIIADGDVELGRVAVGADGRWTLELSMALPDGEHALSVKALDAAGNLSSPSQTYGFTVDTSLPTAPKISNVRDDIGSYTGILQSGGTTDDAMPTINGNGKAGELIEIRSGDELLGSAVVAENGRWSFTPAVALSEGLHTFTAVAISAGGAESSVSNSYSVRVDTIAPDRPIIDAVQDNVGSWMGNLENGQTTDDRTPTFVGRAEASSTIIVYEAGEEVGFATVGEDGKWTYTAEHLSYGEHRFTFRAFDVAGNIGKESEEWSVFVAMAARGVQKAAGGEVPVVLQDLLIDPEIGLFEQATAQRCTSEVVLPAAQWQGGAEVTVQDSWTGRDVGAVAGNGVLASPIETTLSLDQYLLA